MAEYDDAVSSAEGEVLRLKERMAGKASDQPDREAMKHALEALRERNLDKATFDERVDIVSKLGIKVYPSEDVKSMRVVAEVTLPETSGLSQEGLTSISK